MNKTFRVAHSSKPNQSCQQGFSLIELMIAMTIGLIVLGAVGYVFISSRQSFTTTDNMSRMQENARIAIETIARDVRMAGYMGCGNLKTASVTTIAKPYATGLPAPDLSASNAITGTDFAAVDAAYLGTTITRPAGDTITIAGAFRGGVSLTGNLDPDNANMKITGNPFGFTKEDVLMVAGCTSADVFRPTTVSNGAGFVNIAHATSTNTGNRVGTYNASGQVFKMDRYTYFIGTNTFGKRALYRANTIKGTAEETMELVEDVWDMQIEYGMDTDADGAADTYADATGVGTNWLQVVSARINLLMASPDNNVVPSKQTYKFNKSTVVAGDRRLYQVLSSTIAVRNRAP